MGESPVEDPALPFSPVEAVAGADDARLRLRFADASHSLAGVRLIQDARMPADQISFARADNGWELAARRPPVTRMEYLLELRYPDGGTRVITDPANPRQAGGAFGPRSIIGFTADVHGGGLPGRPVPVVLTAWRDAFDPYLTALLRRVAA